MYNKLPDLTTLVNTIALCDSHSAYKRLFTILFPALYRFSFCLVKSKEEAEEVASDVMINLWRDRDKLPKIANIRVYAFVIARNMSLNVLKKRLNKEIVFLDEIEVDILLNAPNPEQILINDELKQTLEKAVQALPAKCKLVFKLIKEEGLSYKETAEILKISIKTVDAHLVSAIKKLTISLKKEFNLA